jgi:hypothetical protein
MKLCIHAIVTAIITVFIVAVAIIGIFTGFGRKE